LNTHILLYNHIESFNCSTGPPHATTYHFYLSMSEKILWVQACDHFVSINDKFGYFHIIYLYILSMRTFYASNLTRLSYDKHIWVHEKCILNVASVAVIYSSRLESGSKQPWWTELYHNLNKFSLLVPNAKQFFFHFNWF